jgi:HEAT repeat protein
MPQDRDFKRLVRRRMAQTGERYTAARAALDPRPPAPGRDVARWVEELASPPHAMAAYGALRALPAERLRPAALAGLDHASWRVRRSCCRLLDDLDLTPESTAALERRLADEHPLVRRAALHTLSCVHCKPDGCALDVGPLFERMASDPSWRVRSAVLNPLAWAYGEEPWTPGLLRRFADHDPSARLRQLAAKSLADLDARLRSDERRRLLPPELRAKTERHRGRWVAVAGGRIVGVDDPRAFRHARRTWPDTAVYWVAATGGADALG